MKGSEVLNNESYDNAQIKLNHDINIQTEVNEGLYDKSFEHDNCGIGAVVNINGVRSHALVDDALKIVESIEPVRTLPARQVTELVS